MKLSEDRMGRVICTMRASLFLMTAMILAAAHTAQGEEVRYYPVKEGSHPHDVAPAPDGAAWFTAQRDGSLGRLAPRTGASISVPLGKGSAPHGVIVGPDGAAWVTDSGLNAVVR